MNVKDYYNEETKVISMPKRDVEIAPQGMGYILFESMKNNFGKIALIDLVTRETDTYDNLFIRTIRTAIKLKNVGVQPGDIISIFSHNQINSITVFLSAFLAGAVNASLDPVFPDEELEYLVRQVSPTIFFVSTFEEKRIEALCKKLDLDAKIVVFGESDRNMSFAEFICPQDGEDSFEPYVTKDLGELCVLKFSSGSTGLPKAMCFSHKYYGYHSEAVSFKNSMTLANLFWIGSVLTALTQIRNGYTYTFACKFNPVALWEDIKTFEITLIQLHPHVALEFIDCKPEDWDGELGALAIVGSSMSEENRIKLRNALPNTKMINPYGMSETYLLMDFACPKAYEKVASVGTARCGIQYKIVNPETGENLGVGQQGELRVKSDYHLSSYFKRDSSDIWDEEGYLKTGDIAYFDEDFSFFIIDRLKEIMKYKGMHISPVRYEKVLENHPNIKLAVLVGIPHKVEGCHIRAVVVPQKGSIITPKEVEEYYNERVPESAKIRAGVEFVDDMPMTASGKIARKKVQDIVISKTKGLY